VSVSKLSENIQDEELAVFYRRFKEVKGHYTTSLRMRENMA
jgi:hypothetical protein